MWATRVAHVGTAGFTGRHGVCLALGPGALGRTCDPPLAPHGEERCPRRRAAAAPREPAPLSGPLVLLASTARGGRGREPWASRPRTRARRGRSPPMPDTQPQCSSCELPPPFGFGRTGSWTPGSRAPHARVTMTPRPSDDGDRTDSARATRLCCRRGGSWIDRHRAQWKRTLGIEPRRSCTCCRSRLGARLPRPRVDPSAQAGVL